MLRFCDQKRKELKTGDRSGECIEILRQLSAYFTVSQKDFRSVQARARVCVSVWCGCPFPLSMPPLTCRLPKVFTELLYNLLSEPEQGPPALRILCFMTLQELLPSQYVCVWVCVCVCARAWLLGLESHCGCACRPS